jgi:DNA-binding NtrC family response regulator
MIKYTIYLVDDDEFIRNGISDALGQDYRIKTYSNAEDLLAALDTSPPDLILLDIGLPGMNGIEALAEIKKDFPDILVIMITAYEDIDTVVAAMKAGAHDYVIKPILMDGLESTIHNALDTIRLRKEVQVLQERYLQENVPCFIGESDAYQSMMDFLHKVADSPDTPILVIGETGTGKELIASAIHFRSPNYKGPFITVNCAAIPKDLIESELFGYEKGAFTGAKASGKTGLIQEAAAGTLFLDEIGDLSLEAQAKLLRFLEAGEFYRVGGTKKLNVKTRVISATNKDIDEMVKDGEFRKDLFFRLGVIKIQVPSLNERRSDILPLAKHFLSGFNQKFGKNYTGFAQDARRAFEEHNWTGNVRELKNLVERGVLTGTEPELTAEDLALGSFDPSASKERKGTDMEFPPIPSTGIDFPSIHESFERNYIEKALEMAAGNESEAARLLNINHHTFRYHRKKLKIDN